MRRNPLKSVFDAIRKTGLDETTVFRQSNFFMYLCFIVSLITSYKDNNFIQICVYGNGIFEQKSAQYKNEKH